MLPLKISNFKIEGPLLIEPEVYYDERGYFFESYVKKNFDAIGIENQFIQVNNSFSKKNVLRGLHFQMRPYEQTKLIRCIFGEIMDVAVDLRKDSPTYGKYINVNLSGDNKNMLYIPKGFAHGFLVLSDFAYVEYLVDNYYSKDHEMGIIWNDKDIGINWPIHNPIISKKDMNWPTLKQIERLLGDAL